MLVVTTIGSESFDFFLAVLSTGYMSLVLTEMYITVNKLNINDFYEEVRCHAGAMRHRLQAQLYRGSLLFAKQRGQVQ